MFMGRLDVQAIGGHLFGEILSAKNTANKFRLPPCAHFIVGPGGTPEVN